MFVIVRLKYEWERRGDNNNDTRQDMSMVWHHQTLTSVYPYSLPNKRNVFS